MQWTRVGKNMRPLAWLLLAILAPLGCGEQDLYKPPKSPYQVISNLRLPSTGEDVSILGDRAYVAAGEAGLLSIDISDPSQPRLATVLGNTPKSAIAVAAASTPSPTGVVDLAFVVDGTEGVDWFDVTNPDSVYYVNYQDTFDANNVLVVLNDDPTAPFSFYTADNWRGLWRFDSIAGDIPAFYMAGRTFTLGSAQAVAVEGGYAYVADDAMGLVVCAVDNPIAMRVLTYFDTPGSARGVAVRGDHAYVADGLNGLVVARIDGGNTPVFVSQLTLSGNCRDVVLGESHAFIAAQDGGMHIVDITDPARPAVTGTVVTPYATGVALGPGGLVALSDRDMGLYLLAGPEQLVDRTGPCAIRSLVAEPRSSTSLLLSWIAPGNDLYHGAAAAYDIRYAPFAITDANWDSSAVLPCEDEPVPARSGRMESYEVTNLAPNQGYYVAIKACDDAGHWSRLSNVGSAITYAGNVPPILSGASVSPLGAAPGTPITFQITYTDPDGDPPQLSEVRIHDGTGWRAEVMTGASEDYRHGVVFSYQEALARGRFRHQFAFADTAGHEITPPAADGPWIGDVYIVGSPADELGRDDDENQHMVVFQDEVWIDVKEVTQAQYQAIMNTNPSRQVGPQRPVENVTWFDAVTYCRLRSIAEELTPAYEIIGDSVAWNRDADGYRLPTEAEWERACRSGTTTALSGGDLTFELCRDANNQPDPVLDQLGWYCGNSGNVTHDVGGKAPNPGGYYDMHGNVWEWCWDWYSTTGVIGDPDGPARGMQRVIRGGSWYYLARECRSASREPYWPNSKDDIVGFRVARTVR